MAEVCGASLVVDAYGPQVVFVRRASLAELQAGAVAPLPDWGLLRLEGIDAVKFLHSQTTNDVAKQPPGEARWHGYCTAKGRLLASMLGWRDETAIRLLLPRPLAAPMRKRLSMFVLRAKVALTDDSDGSAVLGLSGAAAPAALATLGLAVPGPMQVAVAGELTVIGLPPCPVSAASEAAGSAAQAPTGLAQTPAQAAALPRWWLIAPIERLPALWSELAGRLAPVDSEAWRWMDIRCGLPRVLPAGCHAMVDADAWPQPRLMAFLQAQGAIEPAEMARTFNCGIGMAVIVKADAADAVTAALEAAGETIFRIGTVEAGDRGCTVRGSAETWSARGDWTATHHG
ncbi:MAG: hypothetical protein J0H09_27220 [Burkholderiales bacterium]|nr:hypothetical protein [Burkholderiales bacterium]